MTLVLNTCLCPVFIKAKEKEQITFYAGGASSNNIYNYITFLVVMISKMLTHCMSLIMWKWWPEVFFSATQLQITYKVIELYYNILHS